MNRASVIVCMFVMGILLLVSCKPTVPKQFIQPDDMEDLLYDFHLAQSMAMNQDGSPDQRNYNDQLYFDAVLKKHGVSRADFDSSLVYYYTRAEYMRDIYRDVAKRLSEEALSMGASEGEVSRLMSLTANGDTANVWLGDLSAVLLPYAPYNRFDFSQKADTSYRKGDLLLLTFNSTFFCQTGIRGANACLSVTFDNDSVISVTIPLSVSTTNSVRLPEAPNLKPKDISGFIYFGRGNDNATTTLNMLYISDIKLIRLHKKQKDATPQDDNSQPDGQEDSREPLDKQRGDTIQQLDTVGGGALKRGRPRLAPPGEGRAPDRVVGRKLPPPVR